MFDGTNRTLISYMDQDGYYYMFRWPEWFIVYIEGS